jgi:NTP pyrophosphatase (non-canonical NTP hydrolase)
MEFNTYQKEAANLNFVQPEYKMLHAILGLAGETGEVTEKFKKLYRDKQGKIDEAFLSDIKKECGDVLWYLADICTQLCIDLEDVAAYNIEKLQSRAARGKIQGSGDNR